MVDPVSHGVPRAPWYSGTLPGSHQFFAYGAFTRYGGSFQRPSAKQVISYFPTRPQPGPATPHNPGLATPAGLTHPRFRLLPVRSPLLREYFLFLGVHEMFQFPRCPPHQDAVTSASWLGCPIRRSWDHSLLTAPPRLSQLCHVLHRHAAPRHPPSAHTVFPAGRHGVDRSRSLVECRRRSRRPHSIQTNTLHLVRYNCIAAAAEAAPADTGVPSPLNRDDDHVV